MTTKTSTDITFQSPRELETYDRNKMSFQDLVDSSIIIQGYEVKKGNQSQELQGIPFIITKVTFRPGYPDREDPQKLTSYVSCECVIADEPYLTEHKISLAHTSLQPLEHFVLNDGSTGIYRQVVAILELEQMITIKSKKLPGGKKGESRYDTIPDDWEIHRGESKVVVDPTTNVIFTGYSTNVRILAPLGLRCSQYSNEYTGNAVTNYLA